MHKFVVFCTFRVCYANPMTTKPLDTYDIRILNALQQDGSLGNNALAEIVYLSASQCSRRRAALEAAGVIEGYRATLDPQAVGQNLRAIVRLNMAKHDQASDAALSKWLQTQPEIQSAFSVSGDADFILSVRVTDLATFTDFLHEKLLRQPQIGQVRSELILKTLKDDPVIHLTADG